MELVPQGSLLRLNNVLVWDNGSWVVPSSPVVTVSVANPDGTAVPNATNLLIEQPDANSLNNYSITLPPSVVLVPLNIYYVTFSVSYAGLTQPFQQKFRCNYPKGNSVPT